MKIFFIIYCLLLLQRLSELLIAKRNEKWMVSKGGIIYGRKHYPYVVAMHFFFLLSLLFEVLHSNKDLSNFWPILAPILLASQIIRYWAIFSLGKYWNTKIIIVPNHLIESKGPYLYIRHPNYLAVAFEIFFIPILFHAYLTAGIFTFLNIMMMMIRISAEEDALTDQTNYRESFGIKSRFIPRRQH